MSSNLDFAISLATIGLDRHNLFASLGFSQCNYLLPGAIAPASKRITPVSVVVVTMKASCRASFSILLTHIEDVNLLCNVVEW